MARLSGRTSISKRRFHQKINLARLIGETPTSEQKRIFADLATDLIENRSLDGKDAGGNKFTKYSPQYAERKGVTPDSVDMFLEGDMFDAMDRNKSQEDQDHVVIAVKGSKQIKKSFNHQTGDTVKKRQWFGLTQDEAKRVAAKVPKRRKTKARRTIAEIEEALEFLTIDQTE